VHAHVPHRLEVGQDAATAFPTVPGGERVHCQCLACRYAFAWIMAYTAGKQLQMLANKQTTQTGSAQAASMCKVWGGGPGAPRGGGGWNTGTGGWPSSEEAGLQGLVPGGQ
jgi:hypothetical protein